MAANDLKAGAFKCYCMNCEKEVKPIPACGECGSSGEITTNIDIAADHKEIKVLKSTIETDHAIKKDHRVKMKQQAATIERLRGIIEGMLDNAVTRDNTRIFDISISTEMMQEIRQALDTKEE